MEEIEKLIDKKSEKIEIDKGRVIENIGSSTQVIAKQIVDICNMYQYHTN
ncbi:hypothetical protein AGMMS49921_08430 [Endomicrobiia bacterium]|nr:hypothetical protein AGMMS49921_08430 [Endomicrobiia bacterium]